MNTTHPVEYALDTLCAVAAFWPSRIPLAFVAAQPRCRLAAEVHAVGGCGSSLLRSRRGCVSPHRNTTAREDVDGEVGDAWTAWAIQLPFGEWWVSQLAQIVMPSEEQSFAEVPIVEASSNNKSGGGRRHGPVQQTRPQTPPLPPTSSVPHAPASALEYRAESGLSYRSFWERRVATKTHLQAGAVAAPDAAPLASLSTVTWPDCPYPGEPLRCLLVRGGYAGGVHVGHLVSFLIPESPPPPCAEASGGQAAPYRRILHWDVAADVARKQRDVDRPRCPTSTDEETGMIGIHRKEDDDGAASSSFTCGVRAAGDRASLSPSNFTRESPYSAPSATATNRLPDALQGNSWSYSYWWLRRPLCWSRAHSSSTVLAGFANASTNVVAASAAAAAASLYVYGSHPASLPRHLVTDYSLNSASCTPLSCTHLSSTVEANPPLPPSPSTGLTGPSAGECPAFLAALHFHDCRAPTPKPIASFSSRSAAATTAGGGDVCARLQGWCEALRQSCQSCARLTRVEIDLEGCREEPEELGGACRVLQSPSDEADSEQGTCGNFVLRSTLAVASLPTQVFSPSLSSLTEVRICESTVCDVNYLGELPCLRLADLSRNLHLLDAGVRGISRSRSLCIVDLSFCVLVDKAALQVAAVATLEELYLSGTAVSDATLRAIAEQQGHQRQQQQRWSNAREATSMVPHRGLRVLHTDSCRRVHSPVDACFNGNNTGSLSRKLSSELRAGLEDFCASAAFRLPRHEGHVEDVEDDVVSVAAEEEEAVERIGEGISPAEPLPTLVNHHDNPVTAGASTAAHLQEDAVGERKEVDGTVQGMRGTQRRLTRWHALAALQLRDTALHHPLDEVGALPNLQRLSLLQCSSDVSAAAVDAAAAAPPHRRSRSWLDDPQHFTNLRTIHLDGCNAALTEASNLRALALLPSLQNLSLRYTRVRDTDVAAFVEALHSRGGQHPSCPLQRLSLALCRHLSHISMVGTLTSVRVLDLSDTAVQQDLVEALETCAARHTLQVLKLAACAFITNANPLAALPELRRLDLSHTPLTTAGVTELRWCPALTHLSMKSCAGVTHLWDVVSIPTLEVLNVQGAGLYEEAEEEETMASAQRSGRLTPRYHANNNHRHNSSTQRRDVFPADDDVLRRSRLHTLLLSHTKVCLIRRLGLLPALMCLDAGATGVTDAELAKFVCTGMQQCATSQQLQLYHDTSEHMEESGSCVRTVEPMLRAAHSIHDLCQIGAALPNQNLRCGPPLRVLSLQLCRGIFAVGVLGLCPHLTKLDVSSSNVTSRGLVGLHRSFTLRQLRLTGCKGVHDMRPLASICSLTEVEGSGCNVHTGRLMGDAHHRGDDRADGLPPTDGVAMMPHDRLLAAHSDLFSDVNLHESEVRCLLHLVEGHDERAAVPISTMAASYPFPFITASAAFAPQLHYLVLDGCVNIRGGLEALGRLPALVDLSLCNCSGITAASIQQLNAGAQERATKNAVRGTPATLFPSLHSLHLSRCRNLTGSLAGLEALPLLRRVYIVQSGITSVDDVVVALRDRVVLQG